MAKICFEPSGLSIEVDKETLLFDAIRQVGLPIAAPCGFLRVCGKCTVVVRSGAENLSPQNDYERKILQKEKKPLSQRVSCLARVNGDCTISAGYW